MVTTERPITSFEVIPHEYESTLAHPLPETQVTISSSLTSEVALPTCPALEGIFPDILLVALTIKSSRDFKCLASVVDSGKEFFACAMEVIAHLYTIFGSECLKDAGDAANFACSHYAGYVRKLELRLEDGPSSSMDALEDLRELIFQSLDMAILGLERLMEKAFPPLGVDVETLRRRSGGSSRKSHRSSGSNKDLPDLPPQSVDETTLCDDTASETERSTRVAFELPFDFEVVETPEFEDPTIPTKVTRSVHRLRLPSLKGGRNSDSISLLKSLHKRALGTPSIKRQPDVTTSLKGRSSLVLENPKLDEKTREKAEKAKKKAAAAQPPFPFLPTEGFDYARIQIDNDGQLSAVTIDSLFDILTSDMRVHFAFSNTLEIFFHGFRYFMKPEDLAGRIQERFRQPGFDRIRIQCLLLTWLQKYWCSSLDAPALPLLQKFFKEDFQCASSSDAPTVLPTFRKQLETCLEAAKKKEPVRPSWIHAVNAPIIAQYPSPTPPALVLNSSISLERQLVSFIRRQRKDLAEQITLHAYRLYSSIDIAATIKDQMVREAEKSAPENPLLRFERLLCLWVTHTIVNERWTLEERVHLIEAWLDIGSACTNLFNFSSGLAIFCGVAASAVARMKETVMRVSSAHKDQYHFLGELFSGHNNYRGYHHNLVVVRNKRVPFIPLFAPHLRNIESLSSFLKPTRLEDVSSDGAPMINWTAYRTLYQTISDMELGLLPYNLIPVPGFTAALDQELTQFANRSEYAITHELDEKSRRIELRKDKYTNVDPWGGMFVNGNFQPLPTKHDSSKYKLLHIRFGRPSKK